MPHLARQGKNVQHLFWSHGLHSSTVCCRSGGECCKNCWRSCRALWPILLSITFSTVSAHIKMKASHSRLIDSAQHSVSSRWWHEPGDCAVKSQRWCFFKLPICGFVALKRLQTMIWFMQSVAQQYIYMIQLTRLTGIQTNISILHYMPRQHNCFVTHCPKACT